MIFDFPRNFKTTCCSANFKSYLFIAQTYFWKLPIREALAATSMLNESYSRLRVKTQYLYEALHFYGNLA